MAISLTNCCHSLFRYSGVIKSISQMRQFKPASKISNTAIRQCLYPSCGFGNSAEDQDGLWHVPVDRLIISYSRSSGPGGQNVNKVSTKAEVRFHVKTADWIPQDVRQNILITVENWANAWLISVNIANFLQPQNRNRVNKAGELLVTSELSRSQQRNLGDCIKKISYIIAEASKKPPEPTAEDMALRASRLEKRNSERLKQKKINSAIKQTRRVDFD